MALYKIKPRSKKTDEKHGFVLSVHYKRLPEALREAQLYLSEYDYVDIMLRGADLRLATVFGAGFDLGLSEASSFVNRHEVEVPKIRRIIHRLMMTTKKQLNNIYNPIH